MKRRHRPMTQADMVNSLVRRLSPKLGRDQVRDLSLVHHINLDSLRDGSADAALMWQWFGGVLTWSKAAELMGRGVEKMHAQAALCVRVADRYRATGQVTLTDDEYALAVAGVIAMDDLAGRVDRATAIVAAEWSEARINRIASDQTRFATDAAVAIAH